jgi:hypothetical protein
MERKRRNFWMMLWVLIGIVALGGCAAASGAESLDMPEDAVGRVVYFYSGEYASCQTLYDEVFVPWEERCGEHLQVVRIDIGSEEGYEAFIATEEALIGEVGRLDIPTVVVGDKLYVGERAIREDFTACLPCLLESGGNAWPDVPALAQFLTSEEALGDNPFGGAAGGDVGCVDDDDNNDDDGGVCEMPAPIFVLYFSRHNCPAGCDRTRYDLRYLQGVFPQMFLEERDIEEDAALAQKLAERYDVPGDQRGVAPAVVVGEDYLAGESISLETLRATLEKYQATGAEAVWYSLED